MVWLYAYMIIVCFDRISGVWSLLSRVTSVWRPSARQVIWSCFTIPMIFVALELSLPTMHAVGEFEVMSWVVSWGRMNPIPLGTIAQDDVVYFAMLVDGVGWVFHKGDVRVKMMTTPWLQAQDGLQIHYWVEDGWRASWRNQRMAGMHGEAPWHLAESFTQPRRDGWIPLDRKLTCAAASHYGLWLGWP